jgi:hypothetical protein
MKIAVETTFHSIFIKAGEKIDLHYVSDTER